MSNFSLEKFLVKKGKTVVIPPLTHCLLRPVSCGRVSAKFIVTIRLSRSSDQCLDLALLKASHIMAFGSPRKIFLLVRAVLSNIPF